MSDPLTALMHAVQVMNLLKTLIVITLRERDEAVSGGYSPLSSHSSSQQTEEDLYSQHEDMCSQHDEDLYSQNEDLYSHPGIDFSCELRGPPSEYDDHANFHGENEDEDEDGVEVESLSGVEESFLRQLDENKNVAHSFHEQSMSDMLGETTSPQSCSVFNLESGMPFTDSKRDTSSCTSEEEALEEASQVGVVEQASTHNSMIVGSEKTSDVEMVVDQLPEPTPRMFSQASDILI